MAQAGQNLPIRLVLLGFVDLGVIRDVAVLPRFHVPSGLLGRSCTNPVAETSV
jgi:hypothetical protein